MPVGRRGLLTSGIAVATGLAGCSDLVETRSETGGKTDIGGSAAIARVFVSDGLISFHIDGAALSGQVAASELSVGQLAGDNEFDSDIGRFEFGGSTTQEIEFAEGTLSSITVIADEGRFDVLRDGQLLGSDRTQFERSFDMSRGPATGTPTGRGGTGGTTDAWTERPVWPVATDASDGQCRTAAGEVLPATGEDAAPFFRYGGCGTWKEYPATPGEPVRIQASVDAALLTDAAYVIAEPAEGGWEQVRRVEPSMDASDNNAHHSVRYVPSADRFRVRNIDGGAGTGFYVHVYRRADGT